VATPQGEQLIRAKAVVLAAGGFPNDNAAAGNCFPAMPAATTTWRCRPGCSGDGLRLGNLPVAWLPPT
jgi:glycine/D-amino acid oxidase-like deaminating enzyme